MAERLAFGFGIPAATRDLRDRIAWVRPPSEGSLPAAAVKFLVPVDRPNWGFWGVSLFTALLFFRPQDTVPALAPLHLPEVAAVLALLAMVIGRLNRGLPVVRFTSELGGVAAMALVMVLTVPFSIWPGGAMGTFTDVYIKVVLVFVLMIDSVRSPTALRRFSWLIMLAMGYVAMRGVLDYVRGMNLVRGERLHGSISGLMGNPNDLAMNMVTFLPLAAAMALGKGKPLPRAVAALIALLMAATVLFTKSRAGMLGFAAMALVFVLQTRRLRPRLGVAALVLVLAATPMLPVSFWTRVSSITNAEDDETGSRQARKDLMWEGWRTFTSHPFTGVGAGMFKNYSPPGRLEPWRETHNVLLQIAAELGIGGLAAFLFLIVRAVWALRWTGRAFAVADAQRPPPGIDQRVPVTDAFLPDEQWQIRMHVAAMWASLAGWLVCAQFASVGYYWTFYYLLALIVAARELTLDRFEAARKATSPARVDRFARVVA